MKPLLGYSSFSKSRTMATATLHQFVRGSRIASRSLNNHCRETYVQGSYREKSMYFFLYLAVLELNKMTETAMTVSDMCTFHGPPPPRHRSDRQCNIFPLSIRTNIWYALLVPLAHAACLTVFSLLSLITPPLCLNCLPATFLVSWPLMGSASVL